MKKSSIIWLIVIVVIIIILGVWWATSSNSYTTTNQQSGTVASTTTSTAGGSTAGQGTNSGVGAGTGVGATTSTFHAITLNNSGAGQFGEYLSGSNGMTLYQSTKDTTNVSNCTGACATTWPPYTVSPAIAASLTTDPGITGKVSTIKRADGSLQVTYRGLPLYFYTGDTKPGDTKGEAVNGFTEVAP